MNLIVTLKTLVLIFKVICDSVGRERNKFQQQSKLIELNNLNSLAYSYK